MELVSRYSSFRDPRSSVRTESDRVVRTFDPWGAKTFEEVLATGVVDRLAASGLIPGFEVRSHSPLVVESALVPFVSYPQEWTPNMLREAGLLTLEIARTLWSAGCHLRDAGAYNIVYSADKPVFVDLGSFGSGHTGLWDAYGQFCDHFLNPLLIDGHLRVPFNDLWTLEGISVHTTNALLRGGKRLRRGVLRNVVLRSKLERGSEAATETDRVAARSTLSLPPEKIDGSMVKLQNLLEGLDLGRTSHWSGYTGDNSYDPGTEETRRAVISEFAERHSGSRAIDVGANHGEHSLLIEPHFEVVVALDSDREAVDAIRSRVDGHRVYPVVGDIAAPLPGQGLFNRERVSLLDRLAGSDAAIWMAVIHHLAIGRSIPLETIAELLALVARHHLVEFVEPDDPMARLLAASKGGVHHPYHREAFLSAFSKRFEVTPRAQTVATRQIFELDAS